MSLAEIGFLTWLITFNTKITHLGDALAALGNYRDAITCHVNGTKEGETATRLPLEIWGSYLAN